MSNPTSPAQSGASQPQQQVPVQVRYEELTTRYANQVLINATQEEVYLDFSPGVIFDRTSANPAASAILPIHTRIAMTPVGLLRLYQAIGQALQKYQTSAASPAPAPQPPQPV